MIIEKDFDRCYCVDTNLKLSQFEIKLDTICYYRYNQKDATYSVFMQYIIIPFSIVTGRTNCPLFHQYNLLESKFYKHFVTMAEWREKQINSILND